MTKTLEKGIAAVRSLSDEQQDHAGELLLALAEQNRGGHRLSPEQVADVKLAIAEADRGDFASDGEMAAFWKKCGL
jgi:hypothetical protein